MSVEIDETTGLPKLPERHFWRIGRETASIRESVPEGEWLTCTGSFCKSLEHRTVKSGWFIVPLKVKEHRTKASSEHVYTMNTEPSAVSLSGDYTIYTKITKDNLLEYAEKAYAAWREYVGVTEVYGDYPPKKFESSNNE